MFRSNVGQGGNVYDARTLHVPGRHVLYVRRVVPDAIIFITYGRTRYRSGRRQRHGCANRLDSDTGSLESLVAHRGRHLGRRDKGAEDWLLRIGEAKVILEDIMMLQVANSRE